MERTEGAWPPPGGPGPRLEQAVGHQQRAAEHCGGDEAADEGEEPGVITPGQPGGLTVGHFHQIAYNFDGKRVGIL
jgi:hypothetical protein